MTVYLLDTSALLTLRDNEPGAQRVGDLLEQAQLGAARCFGSFMSLMETVMALTNRGVRVSHDPCGGDRQ